MQRIRQEFFKDRAVYYSSGLIQDQAPKGKSDWDYSLKEVYFIGLMDSVLEDSATEEYLHHVRLVYEKSGQEFYKKLGFIFIEIPKFTKSEEDLKTGVDKWLFILKNMSRLQKIPLILNTRIFSKLFKIAAVANLTKEEFMKYAKDQKASWDEYATKQTLLKEGMELGMEEAKYQVVRKLLLTDRFTIAEVANFATVTEAFVSKVKKNLK